MDCACLLVTRYETSDEDSDEGIEERLAEQRRQEAELRRERNVRHLDCSLSRSRPLLFNRPAGTRRLTHAFGRYYYTSEKQKASKGSGAAKGGEAPQQVDEESEQTRQCAQENRSNDVREREASQEQRVNELD